MTPTMDSFPSSTPRVTFVIAAVAMTAITFGLLVVVPATIESGGEDARPEAMAKVATPEAAEVVITPARIEAIGACETEMASAPVSNARSKHNQGG